MSFEATLRDFGISGVRRAAIERRERLLMPQGGRVSSEADILSAPILSRQRRTYIERSRKIERYEKTRLAFKAYQMAFIHRHPQPENIVETPSVAPPEEPPLIDATTVWPITVRDIARAACRHFNVNILDVVSHRRHGRIVRVRQIIMHLARNMTTRSYPEIGRVIGNRDHTTCMHADRRITALVQTDENVAAAVEAVRALVMAGRT